MNNRPPQLVTLAPLEPPVSAPSRPLEPQRASFDTIVIRDESQLAPWADAWQDLADSAIEQNVFYEPWMLLPALKHLDPEHSVRVALVFGRDPQDAAAPPLLCGLFPLVRTPRYRHLPAPALSFWKHEYCFLCTPLIRRGFQRQCLQAFMDWLASGASGGAAVEFNCVSGDGPFQLALIDCLNQRRQFSFAVASHSRAILRPALTAEVYLRQTVSGETRRDWRRRWRQLAQQGNVRSVALQPEDDVHSWLKTFLALEAGGWKGRKGTAMASKSSDRQFFVDVASAAFARRRLLAHSLELNGRPVAQRVSLLSSSVAFAFKAAFDETYAHQSPGVLLEIEAIQHAHHNPAYGWMDSCTARPDHIIHRLWKDRRIIQTLLVSSGSARGDLLVSLLPMLRWLNRRLPARRS
jgi:hypothetical protein